MLKSSGLISVNSWRTERGQTMNVLRDRPQIEIVLTMATRRTRNTSKGELIEEMASVLNVLLRGSLERLVDRLGL